jgi:hypothetical protein
MSVCADLLFNVLNDFSLQTYRSRRMQSWSFPQCLHLQPGLFASAVTGHVRVRKLAVQRAQCLQPADVHFSCAELELLSAFFVCIVCALRLFACVLCACSLCFWCHC